jgi:hypothetical protein
MGNIERDMTMTINMDNDKNIPIDTDAYYEYYEELASQEELYLEEMEEEVRLILTSYVSSASGVARSIVTENCGLRESDLEIRKSLTDPKNDPRKAESRDEQLVDASEELITGDADDPPMSEKAVQEMLNDTPAGGSDIRVDRGGERQVFGSSRRFFSPKIYFRNDRPGR